MAHTQPLQTDTFLPYMRDVIRCEQALHELNLMWRMIESSAKMNCPEEARAILPTMAATRNGFNRLEQELVTSLVNEKVVTVLDEIGTKAQYVIDILVRNLYERTADVGFLATDTELCAFVSGQKDDQQAVRKRLRAYRDKYTVYDEIILLDTAGNVLVQIDEATPLEGSSDPLIAQTLGSSTFVETFRASDLRPAKRQALIYSRRMLHPENGKVTGILCLCFNFEQEMAGIFRTHQDPAKRSNMLLLDSKNCVIESADKLWIPLGAIVPVNQTKSPQLMMFAGREYLVRTFCTQGYQGYMGPPGWQGQVMIPVDVAFTGRASNTLSTLDPRTRAGLLSHAQSFSAPLYEIMNAAQTIRSVVWNGQVMAAGRQGDLTKLKNILAEIGETGARSDALFAKSIGDLYETVLTTSLHNSEFVSRLLVDLLDRNLYERSDDCRWWAMTPDLRIAFDGRPWDDTKTQKISAILKYIHGLYTVYSCIFVYDASGRIVASTQVAGFDNSSNGGAIDAVTLGCVRALRTEQDYYVTPFSDTPLYAGQPTYTYHAAVRDLHDESRVVGGIGIVFDAAREFVAMLQGGLGNQTGMTALFVNRAGRVVSSTASSQPVGSVLTLNRDLLDLPNGGSASRVVVHEGQYAILGCTVSSGYREFKVSDGYQDDVLALVFEPLGKVQTRLASGLRMGTSLRPDASDAPAREFATFLVNDALFALPATHVQEALPASHITAVPVGDRKACVGLLALHQNGANRDPVWVFDLAHLVCGIPARADQRNQVILVRRDENTIGLLVDELHGVPEFNDTQFMRTPFGSATDGALIQHFIKADGGQVLIQVINVDALFAVQRTAIT